MFYKFSENGPQWGAFSAPPTAIQSACPSSNPSLAQKVLLRRLILWVILINNALAGLCCVGDHSWPHMPLNFEAKFYFKILQINCPSTRQGACSTVFANKEHVMVVIHPNYTQQYQHTLSYRVTSLCFSVVSRQYFRAQRHMSALFFKRFFARIIAFNEK